MRKLPVIMLTTTDDPREVARCHELGCSNYIVKPVDYEKFAEAIQELGLFISLVQVPGTQRHGLLVRRGYADTDPSAPSSLWMTTRARAPFQKALQREGFSTVPAHSGKEALTWLLRHRADLMLLDLKLPDIEGKALVDHLADIQRCVPFIVITGQGDERMAVEMMKRGALDYLVKDVDFLQFVPEVVRRALGEWASNGGCDGRAATRRHSSRAAAKP